MGDVDEVCVIFGGREVPQSGEGAVQCGVVVENGVVEGARQLDRPTMCGATRWSSTSAANGASTNTAPTSASPRRFRWPQAACGRQLRQLAGRRLTGPLQRLYGSLTRMITERQNASGPVRSNRGTLTVRLWETSEGHLTASLTRRKGATIAPLTLPAELAPLRELHAKVVAQMEARGIPRQPWTKNKK
ncbi:hypothetical protein [Streptomyces aureus]|uniref:hypothetical protein n=1 Tax=Streptomyces aureus TaxID=193461 RepID=UPI0036A77F9C